MSQSKTNSRLFPRDPITLMYRVYRYILPEVKNQLTEWRRTAEAIPDKELRTQSIASLTSKKFHCQGGAVYAAANLPERNVLIPLIVAFQTISDYLDNLCDRSTSMDAQDFRQLHQAMLDAVDLSKPIHDYYAFHNEKEDGGYLRKLVMACQSYIDMLPKYSLVQANIIELVSLYCDLQVYKHIDHSLRENELLAWWDRYKDNYQGIHWNEFAAATGSTLGVFMLFLASTDTSLDKLAVAVIRNAYFPHVCSLHILLDYLIDQEEDREGGDLNFCNYYNGMNQTLERIHYIVEEARKDIQGLNHSGFHRMIIEGLLALYLSDPKVRDQQQVRNISKQLMKNSPLTRLFFWMNSVWIRKLK